MRLAVIIPLCTALLIVAELVFRSVFRIHDAKTRWFCLHAACNFVVAFLVLDEVGAVFVDPLHAMDATVHAVPFREPMTIVVVLHAHHLAWHTTTAADRWHHLVFMPTIAVPGLLYNWGALQNCLVFFICGLPGGVTYALLALRKSGRCVHVDEKRVTANLNIWIRCPGVLFCITVAYQAAIYGNHAVPMWAMLLQLTLTPLNAMYYAKQSVFNYAMHRTLTHGGGDGGSQCV